MAETLSSNTVFAQLYKMDLATFPLPKLTLTLTLYIYKTEHLQKDIMIAQRDKILTYSLPSLVSHGKKKGFHNLSSNM